MIDSLLFAYTEILFWDEVDRNLCFYPLQRLKGLNCEGKRNFYPGENMFSSLDLVPLFLLKDQGLDSAQYSGI